MTTLLTAATSSARELERASSPAKATRLAILKARATVVDEATAASSTTRTTKTSKSDTLIVSSTSHNALDQAATAAATVTVSASATSSSTSSSTSTKSAAGAVTAVPSGYSVPGAFDSTLGTNFTSTACPSFFQTFLADPDFIACAPFSLLLATSSAFFKAQQSPDVLLPFVMNATCTVNQTACSAIMDDYATQIRAASTCGPDLTKRNPLVVEALSGFQNYNMMYDAGCLQNNETGKYCFAEAAAATTASELYFWYLPEGTGLPSGTQTSCESCTQNLMALFAQYATNDTLLISNTYAGARTLAVSDCGPTFAPFVAQASAALRGAFARPAVQLALLLAIVGGWSIM